MNTVHVLLAMVGVAGFVLAGTYRWRMLFHAERAEYWYTRYRETDEHALKLVKLARRAIDSAGTRQGKEPTADAPMKEGT